MTIQTHSASVTTLQATHETINLYQSSSIDDGFAFVIESLDDLPLARLHLTQTPQGEYWSVETEPLTIDQAKTLGRDLQLQHYQFHISEGRFHITAWNLLDAHYICNLVALHELSSDLPEAETVYAA